MDRPRSPTPLQIQQAYPSQFAISPFVQHGNLVFYNPWIYNQAPYHQVSISPLKSTFADPTNRLYFQNETDDPFNFMNSSPSNHGIPPAITPQNPANETLKQEPQSDEDEDVDIQIASKSNINNKKQKSNRAKKRKFKETFDEDFNDNEPSTKKRRSTARELEECITETITAKECRKKFDVFVKNGDCVISGKDKYLCRIDGCNKKYKVKCHLKRHVDEIHLGRMFECSECGADYKQKSQCKAHLRNVHFNCGETWHCPYCMDEFSRYGGVKRHLQLKRCKVIKYKMLPAKEIKLILADADNDKIKEECQGPA